ncbi:hypothetical protein [Actinoplanes sp. NPDC049265]|uniref:hypothetical protein n=1 Tax=Actinoplanes sp. NPDC049265 TaxID=3363902 RepID=UPI003719E3B9
MTGLAVTALLLAGPAPPSALRYNDREVTSRPASLDLFVPRGQADDRLSDDHRGTGD